MAAEIFGEDLFADGDRPLLRHGAEAEFRPRLLGAFDDECRGVGIELIGVRPDPAVLGLLEDESEGVVEFLLGAEPRELAFAHIDVRLEVLRKLGADLRVKAVGRNDQIMGLGKARRAFDLGLELQLDAERASPLLQQDQELLASDAAEAMAGRDNALAAIIDGDVVPIGEVRSDRFGTDGIVGGEIGERLVGEHDAPAEGVVGPIALDDGDVMRRIAQLHADREIKARRAATDARNLHATQSFVTGRNLARRPRIFQD